MKEKKYTPILLSTVFVVIIKVGFYELSGYSLIALFIFINQLLELFFSLNKMLPIRYLFGFMMSLQMLFAPVLAYNGLNDLWIDTYQMKVSENEYFTYVLPAVILFITGLNIGKGKYSGEVLNIVSIREFVGRNPKMPIIFIVIGFITELTQHNVGSELKFVFYLFGSLKYIGVFLLILGKKELKTILLFLVYGSILFSSLAGGMFHDLLIWLIMLGAVFSIKYQPNFSIKMLATSIFIIFVGLIQLLKTDYRDIVFSGEKEGGLATFKDATVNKNKETEGGVFSKDDLADNVVRINQGFIVSTVMQNVPANIPFAEGTEMYAVLESAVLPRFLAPNKLNAGDQALFMNYTGMILNEGTAMALGSLSDAYLNFNVIGGSIFMLFLGLLFNFLLKFLNKQSRKFPIILIFVPMIFAYPIRPDCELQTILGHLVKSIFLIFSILYIFKNTFGQSTLKNSNMAS